MKIYFKNGSRIESIDSNSVVRGNRFKHYYFIDDFNLKWWQKIYLKVYYHCFYWIFNWRRH